MWPFQRKLSTPVTLAGLPEHSAGFTDIGRAEFDSNRPMPLEAALRKFASGRRVAWQPGLYSAYSNLGAGGAQPLLPRNLLRRIEQPATTLAARTGVELGYGLGNYAWLRDGVLFHGRGGDAGGHLSRFGYSHELGRGYFLVINAFNGAALRAMQAIVERALIDGFGAPEAPPAVAVDPEAFGMNLRKRNP